MEIETQVKRGRPKDLKVAARDEAVRKIVEKAGFAGISRNDIRDRIGETGSRTSLSLIRLRSRGLVEKCLDARGRPVWCRPDWEPFVTLLGRRSPRSWAEIQEKLSLPSTAWEALFKMKDEGLADFSVDGSDGTPRWFLLNR